MALFKNPKRFIVLYKHYSGFGYECSIPMIKSIALDYLHIFTDAAMVAEVVKVKDNAN